MKKLLAYEFRKTRNSKVILLGITVLLEAVFLLGLLLGSNDMIGIGAMLLYLSAFGGILYIGIESVVILHRDMNTKQGYMVFMTPNSSYKILGAKILENGLSILAAGAFFGALGALDITLLLGHYGELERLWDLITQMVQTLNSKVDLQSMSILLTFCFELICSWLAIVTAAYLADVVSCAILNGKKGNGLVAFALFAALSVLMAMVQSAVNINGSLEGELLLSAGIAIVFSVGMVLSAAAIMDRHLSV